MSKFQAPMRRKNTARGHYYVDANGIRIPGVTTILGDGLPKKALINWAASATAEYAIDNWDELGDLSASARLKKLNGGRYGVTDKAKKRGTEVHGYAERLVKGEKVTGVPELLRGHVEAYARFLDRFDVQPVVVEESIVNYTIGYAGTLDLIADILNPETGQHERWLLDAKTNEKGIYGETALQLAAYRNAEFLVDAEGNETPMLDVVRCGAIHITSSDAQLIPVLAERQQFLAFRYAQQIAEFDAGSRDLVGAPLDPPHESTIASIEWKEAKA
ncbi:hypothetical protein L5I01_17350 [Gordonia sp. HY442]|uniref:hypothetical protein n=1 Tax=Gordonia zhenghanii TaxID=2911516 RepID=UPI001F327D32|nr:hypothetical protein [Gordonia zhenghanii]MCF8605123.1 hypothetical protein [Gordonia zhenghanii]